MMARGAAAAALCGSSGGRRPPPAARRRRPPRQLFLLSLSLFFLARARAADEAWAAASPDLIAALSPPQPPGFRNGVAAAEAEAATPAAADEHEEHDSAILLAPQLQALDGARARLERAAAASPALAELRAQLGALRTRLARLPAAWGLLDDAEGATSRGTAALSPSSSSPSPDAALVVDFGPLLPPPPSAGANVTAAWGPLVRGVGGAGNGGHNRASSSFQDAALLCRADLSECWRRFGPAKSGALRAALQAEAVRGVEAAAEKRARQLRGALDWAALAAAAAAAKEGLGGGVGSSGNGNGSRPSSSSSSSPHPRLAGKRPKQIDRLLGPAADAALDGAVGALAALAAADAVLAFGEAQAAAAVRVASLLLPVRVALNPRAVVGQTLQLAVDAARTGFRPAMLFPFLVDGRVNNFQELAGFSAQTAVDAVTSGLDAVIAGFDRAARRWWRAEASGGGGGGRKGGGTAGDAALAALAAGPGGTAAVRALLLGGSDGKGGGGGNGTAAGAAAPLLERVLAAATAAAASTSGALPQEAPPLSIKNATALLPPAVSALILRAGATATGAPLSLPSSSSPSSSSPPPPQHPLSDELRATLGVAGDLFVEWSRASARDLEHAAAALDAAVPGPSPAEAVRRARDALARRAGDARAALERAFPAKDVLEAADVLRAASDEILAAAEQAAAVAAAPDAPGVLAARDALSGLARGMRLASRPLAAAADAAFRSPPFLANATLASVRALAQEGADEVEAAAARVRADYGGGGEGPLALLAPEAVLAAARRAADRALAGAADAASGLLAVVAAAGGVGGGVEGGSAGAAQQQQQQQQQQQREEVARALAEGLPGQMEPLVRSIAAAVSVVGRGAGRGGGGEEGLLDLRSPNDSSSFAGERRAWEEAARALDARAGGALRELATRVAALAEAVPVAADAIAGAAAAVDGGGGGLLRSEDGEQQQYSPSPVAVAAALLEAAAAGRVASARGAMQGALLRLNAQNLEAAAEDFRDRERTEAAQAAIERALAPLANATTSLVVAARRLRAGSSGGGGRAAAAAAARGDGPSSSARPSLAARANVVLARSAVRVVEASRAALQCGAEASLVAQETVAAMLRRAAAQGATRASSLAAAARDRAPAAADLSRRARTAADMVSRGITESLSPVVSEGVRMGERVVRGWLDAALAVVAGGRR